MWIMTAIEFYRLTEETLNNLAKAYDIKNLEEYNKLTDVISLKNTNFKNLSEIEQVFAQIAFHGQNGTLISNIVDFKENFVFLSNITENFNPIKFLDKYSQYNDSQIDEFKKAVVEDLRKELKWKVKVGSQKPDAIATRYAGILIYTAKYLAKFETKEAVEEDLMSHYENNDYKLLIKYFMGKIPCGFSVPLSCDFLKEFSPKFDLPKPDVHLKSVMNKYMNISYGKSDKDNYKCIQDTMNLVKEINGELKKEGKEEITVYQFDRMIYLVCSQNFFLDDKTKGIKKVYLDKIK